MVEANAYHFFSEFPLLPSSTAEAASNAYTEIISFTSTLASKINAFEPRRVIANCTAATTAIGASPDASESAAPTATTTTTTSAGFASAAIFSSNGFP